MTSSGLPAPFRPLPIRMLNGLGRTSARVGVQLLRGALDPARLLEQAARMAKLDDYGDTSFREGFHVLLRSLEDDARLSSFGRFFAKRQVLELLVNRLRVVASHKSAPEVGQEKIEAPIFVLGLPRTGTTLLQGLLAEDPENRAAMSWEVDDPSRPATPEGYAGADPRIEITEKRFEQLRQLAPGMQAVHPVGSTMPQECIVITACAFHSIRFEMCFDVPSYQEWMVAADPRPSYRFHRRFLQHLQSGGRRGRWVLKSPGHLGTIDSLLGEYPDARIVQLHRDPARIVPSVASLEYNIRTVSTDVQDPRVLGEQNLWLWSIYLERGLDARQKFSDKADQFIDFQYREFVDDPIASVHRIYEQFGMTLSPEAEARMTRHLADNPQHKFGKHHYSLEMFGLDRKRVDDAFARYREHFQVDIEAEP